MQRLLYNLYRYEDWCSKIQQQAYSTINDFIPINPNIIQYKQLNTLCKSIFNKKDNTENISSLLKIVKEIITNNTVLDKIDNPSQLLLEYKIILKTITIQKLSIDDIAKEIQLQQIISIRSFKKDMNILHKNLSINQKLNIAKKTTTKPKQKG